MSDTQAGLQAVLARIGAILGSRAAPMSIDRLCKDCRWIVCQGDGANCGHPSARRPRPQSLVIGAPVQLSCDEARSPIGSLPGLCGPDGKHWEPSKLPGFV